MESQFFEYQSSDIIDTNIIQYYDCTLMDVLPGWTLMSIPCIVIDYTQGTMSFWDHDELLASFK